MTNPFLSFISQIIGAFIVWSIKGFKGKMTDEMARPHESSKKSYRNSFLSATVFFCIYLILKYNL